MTAPKRLTELTSTDFATHRLWLAELPALEFARPAGEITNLEADSPIVGSTTFILRDGTRMDGFCFVYDETGFTVFGDSGSPVQISDTKVCSEVEAKGVADRLRKDVDAVFPIRYEAAIRVLGRIPAGEIRLQTNSTPHTDARTSAVLLQSSPGARAGGRGR